MLQGLEFLQHAVEYLALAIYRGVVAKGLPAFNTGNAVILQLFAGQLKLLLIVQLDLHLHQRVAV